MSRGLEALEIIKSIELSHTETEVDETFDDEEWYTKHEYYDGTVEENYSNEIKTIEEALQRLESIDNSSPSEALECLERIENNILYLLSDCDVDVETDTNFLSLKEHKSCEKIRNYILKQQEPKHYLKWEDLEFKEEGQDILVLLNGTKYRMYCWKGYDERINILTENETSVIHIFEGCCPQDIQFFNDLHLEVVAE